MAAGAILLGLSLVTAGPAVAATTIQVTTTNDELNSDGDCSLREAVEATNTDLAVDACPAGSGRDTINVPDGVYLLVSEQLTISGNVIINGTSAKGTIIDGNHSHIVLGITPDQGYEADLRRLTVRNGNASSQGQNGGGIWAGGVNSTLRLNWVAVTGNFAPGYQGGIAPAVITFITNSTISGNRAGIDGGGLIMNGARMEISNSTISGNTAIRNGGGIFSQGPLRMTNVTISNNRAGGAGGGIYNNLANATLNGVTVTGNVADSDADGGGDGGGIFNAAGGTVAMGDTIVAGNRYRGGQPRDCAGKLASHGYALLGATSGCTVTGEAAGNLLGVDPRLGPLRDNGGPTSTHAPLVGSPAIDAGNPVAAGSSEFACPAADQRGVFRPKDGDGDGHRRCDIGAVERKP